MTTLTIHKADSAEIVRGPVTNIDDIIATLADINIAVERWPIRPLAANAEVNDVLTLYGNEVAKLNTAHGFQSVDAIRVLPGAPGGAEMRAKFLDEHTHDDDEIRFFVEGTGAFYIRHEGFVYQIICMPGDLIAVPRGTKHWFDMGPVPNFTVIRFFTQPNGWQASFTGDDIAKRLPLFDQDAA